MLLEIIEGAGHREREGLRLRTPILSQGGVYIRVHMNPVLCVCVPVLPNVFVSDRVGEKAGPKQHNYSSCSHTGRLA